MKLRDEQVKKDLQELYPGKDIRLLQVEFYKKKRKDRIIIFLAGLFLILLTAYSDYQNNILPKGNEIIRNEYGEGRKEIQLQVKKEKEQWEDITVHLEEKEYTKEELEQLYHSFIIELESIVLGENKDADSIEKDLNFISELEEYPFYITWKSSDVSVIDSSGKITGTEIKEKNSVDIRADISHKDWNWEYIFQFTLAPVVKDTLWEVREFVKEKEEKTRSETAFTLPDAYHGTALKWRLPSDRTYIYMVGIVFIGMIFVWLQQDSELRKEVKRRREKIEQEYPEFISSLILYLEAGLSMRSCLQRISYDYIRRRKQGKEKNYLYEEIYDLCLQMKNGLPEKEAYELLGKRCCIPCFRKLVSLMNANLERGNSQLMDAMRKEIRDANEAVYKKARKKGEEMGTKLLIPMMFLLGIVMVLIMIPACFSFQI